MSRLPRYYITKLGRRRVREGYLETSEERENMEAFVFLELLSCEGSSGISVSQVVLEGWNPHAVEYLEKTGYISREKGK